MIMIEAPAEPSSGRGRHGPGLRAQPDGDAGAEEEPPAPREYINYKLLLIITINI